jgi:threonine aldolase
MSAFHYGDNQHKADGQTVIDFRSDTVTKPCAAMREAMAKAEVGDDVYEDDMTVKALEQDVADMLGKDAGLYVPTGTMSNLIAVMSHCQRGEEIILADQYHIAIDEASGASVLGSVAIHPLVADARGAITPEQVRNAIKPDDSHYAMSKLVGLENTVSGRIQDQQNIDAIVQVAKDANLNVHMDGARLLNAAIAQDLPPARLVQGMDSVSLCLSKGLGAPMGSVLSGDAAFIRRGRRLRKMLGAGMRQVGIVAAAGRYALANNVQRLADDHRRARELAQSLQGIDGLQVDMQRVETNMLFLQSSRMVELGDYLAARGIIVSAFSEQCRVVIHKDIDDQAIAAMQQHIREFFAA